MNDKDAKEALLDIGCRMAQELREFCDEADQASGQEHTLKGVEELLDEYDKLVNSLDPWQNKIAGDGDLPVGLQTLGKQ